jgi:hypothetical protein
MKRTGALAVLFTLSFSAFFAFFSGAALAQGSGSSGSPEPIGQPGFPAGRDAPFIVTRTVKGTLAEINVDENQLVVVDKKGNRVVLKAASDTEYKAARKTVLADKKDLTLRDFQIGQPVRVVYVPEKETAVEVRLLKK